MNNIDKLFFLPIIIIFLSLSAKAQNVNYSGTIYDKAEKLPLPSVSIFLKAEKNKFLKLSDDNGNFSLSVPLNSEIIFKYVGFEVYVKVIKQAVSNDKIYLQTESKTMNEVIISGYRAQKRQDFTGAATVITAKELEQTPVANVMELLQGRVAGLNIQNNNGAPGSQGTIQIRGISNINITGTGNDAYLSPTSPLFVIDGVPIDDPSTYEYGFQQAAGAGISPLSLIPVEDIAEIQVLKDAQATSLYGSKGAYGVIIISTVRGRSKVPIITASSSFFVSTPPTLRDVIVGKAERLARIEQVLRYDTAYYHSLNLVNQSNFLSDSLNVYYNNNTDWQGYFYRSTFNQSHAVNFSGGDDKFNYKVNTGLYDEKGIVANTGFNRYSIRMNMGYQASDKFRFLAYVNGSLGKNNKGSGNALSQNGIATSGNTSSLLPSPSLYTASNQALSALSIENANKTYSISTNIQLDYTPFKGGRIGTTIGYTHNSGTEDTFYPAMLNLDRARIIASNTTSESLYNRTNMSYNITVGTGHNFGVSIFQEIDANKSKGNSISLAGLANNQVWGPSSSTTSGTVNAGVEARGVGYAGSFSYNYKSRYVLDFNYRTDGSSRNGPDVPWKKSPSAGVRWNISNEPFFTNVPSWFNNASVRASWGKTIIPTGDVYDIYGKYNTDGTTYNNVPSISLELTDIPNTSLIPSTSTQWNGGMDATFFKSRLNISVDAYYKQVDNILRRKEISSHNAFLGVNTNETSLVNYGWELSISARPLSPKSKLKWSISFNTGYNKDILAALPDGIRQIITDGGGTEQPVINRLGTNALSNYLLVYKGVYARDADVPVNPLTGLRYRTGGTLSEGRYFRAGDPIWADLNGDYILDINDRVVVGNAQPRFTGGFSTSLQYGPFSFSTSISMTIGRDVLNNALAERFRSFSDPMSQTALVPISAYDFWDGDGGVNKFPSPYDFTRYTLYNPFRYDQTLFQEDGSYVKINGASFSYNINQKFTKRLGISSVRVNASVNNVYTFTNYSGPNPESVTALGRDSSGGYPNRRSYSLGLNLQF